VQALPVSWFRLCAAAVLAVLCWTYLDGPTPQTALVLCAAVLSAVLFEKMMAPGVSRAARRAVMESVDTGAQGWGMRDWAAVVATTAADTVAVPFVVAVAASAAASSLDDALPLLPPSLLLVAAGLVLGWAWSMNDAVRAMHRPVSATAGSQRRPR
jgi:hypothetical protein